MSELTLAHSLAASVARHVTDCFGLMGNGNAHFIDGLVSEGVRYHAVRHEAATVASADAFNRVSGRLAVATATYGAGFTNTLTALAEAAQARVPLLLVVGDAPTTGARPWDIDQRAMASAVSVPTFELTADDVDGVVDAAVRHAVRERVPAVLAVPYDLVSASATPGAERPVEAAAAAEPSAGDLDAAAGILARAERPVVLAGRGAWLAGGDISDELGRVADVLGALTATTALGRGLFPRPEFDLGVTGGFGQEAAMAKISEADAVLVVGAGLNQFTMQFGELFGEGTAIVRIDTDPVAPPKSAHEVTHLLLQGDALPTLRALTERLEAVRPQPSGWRERVEGLEPGGALRARDTGADEHVGGRCPDSLLDPRAVAVRIGELLPENRHVTSDGGHFIGWANMFWSVASPERMIMVGTAFQTIGLGFSTVPGVAAAAPDSTVVLTTGDGGGLMALADLESAIRCAASCVIVVWNDAAYGAEVHLYGLMGLDQEPMAIPQVDFAGLAAALGAESVRVESLADLDALGRWRDAGACGTLLLDCRVSPSVVAPYQREVQRANGLDV